MSLLDVVLALHFVGLALGLGTGFSMAALGRASADLEPAERGKFMLRAMVLAKNGSVGLVLLIVTGVWLLFAKWGGGEFFRQGPKAFHIKLTLVVLGVILLGLMQVAGKRARAAAGTPEGAQAMLKLAKLGPIMLINTIVIVLLAAATFH